MDGVIDRDNLGPFSDLISASPASSLRALMRTPDMGRVGATDRYLGTALGLG